MLTDYSSCYKHPTPLQEEKNSPKTKDCQIVYVKKKSLGVFKHWCLLISKRKKYVFLFFTHAFRKKVIAYHTGSEFTQQYYVCRV